MGTHGDHVHAIMNNNCIDRFFVNDGILHRLIGFFSTMVVALLWQGQSLVDELHGLEGELGNRDGEE